MELNRYIIEKLRNEYGEAFYLLDSEQFEKNFVELKKCFSDIYSNFNIAYSYKTNYTPKLCKIVDMLGGYAEVVSEMEMELALRIGVDPRKIIWNGPIKNPAKVETFLISGGTINIDSLEELPTIKAIAEDNTDVILNLGIRCNYDVADGVTSRFGFDVESDDFQRVLEFIRKYENLNLVNLQCHFAKRQVEFWSARAKGMISVIDKIGVVPDRIDLGGGIFGKMEDSLKKQFSSRIPDYKEYAEAAASVIYDYFKNKEKEPELIIEPGSALVGDCMKFVGTIKTIKNIRGKSIASVLGSQKNISMTGVNPPIKVIPMGDDQKQYTNLDLVGFTCIESDVLYKNYCGSLAVGDAVVISNCGSYSLVMKPPFILPNFPVLDICDEQVEVIKKAETFEDIFHTFQF